MLLPETKWDGLEHVRSDQVPRAGGSRLAILPDRHALDPGSIAALSEVELGLLHQDRISFKAETVFPVTCSIFMPLSKKV